MATASKTAQALKYLLRGLGSTGTTKLLKLAYLSDLEARSLLAKPITNLRYEWYNYGPFDKQFYVAIEELEAVQAAVRDSHRYPNGMVEDRVLDAGDDAPNNTLTPGEKKILDYVLQRFGPLELTQVLAYVYETEPMKLVKTKNEVLPMHVVDGQLRNQIGFDLDDIISRERRARAGFRIPAREFFNGLRARVSGQRG